MARTHRSLVAALGIAASLLAATPAFARTRTLHPTGIADGPGNDTDRIQAVIDAARDGDVIRLRSKNDGATHAPDVAPHAVTPFVLGAAVHTFHTITWAGGTVTNFKSGDGSATKFQLISVDKELTFEGDVDAAGLPLTEFREIPNPGAAIIGFNTCNEKRTTWRRLKFTGMFAPFTFIAPFDVEDCTFIEVGNPIFGMLDERTIWPNRLNDDYRGERRSSVRNCRLERVRTAGHNWFSALTFEGNFVSTKPWQSVPGGTSFGGGTMILFNNDGGVFNNAFPEFSQVPGQRLMMDQVRNVVVRNNVFDNSERQVGGDIANGAGVNAVIGYQGLNLALASHLENFVIEGNTVLNPRTSNNNFITATIFRGGIAATEAPVLRRVVIAGNTIVGETPAQPATGAIQLTANFGTIEDVLIAGNTFTNTRANGPPNRACVNVLSQNLGTVQRVALIRNDYRTSGYTASGGVLANSCVGLRAVAPAVLRDCFVFEVGRFPGPDVADFVTVQGGTDVTVVGAQ